MGLRVSIVLRRDTGACLCADWDELVEKDP